MKFAIVALCFIGCALAAEELAQVVRNDYEQTPEGNYQYTYETDNGIFGQASAALKTVGKEVALEVTGSNQYKSPEGETFLINYTADENGYHPQGSHLPTPPAPIAVPEYIERALAYIAAHPYKEEKKV